MLGQMQRRVMAFKREDDEEDSGTPTYPVGRRNAVGIAGTGYIFFRDDGSRRATFDVPANPGGGLPDESGRLASRTWFLFRDATGSRFFTADYLGPPTNVRVPTPAEDPDGNYRRVYDQKVESYVVESRSDVIVGKTLTGSQTFLVGTRQTTPGPNDAYTRKAQTGVKALTAIVINGQIIWGEAAATGGVVQGVANYPPVAVTGRVGEFDLYNRYAGGSGAGDTLVVNAPQRAIIAGGGGVFTDLGRPVTEAEAPVNLERTF